MKHSLLTLLIGWLIVGLPTLNAQDQDIALTEPPQNKILTKTNSLEESLNQLEETYNVTLIYMSHLVEGKSTRAQNVQADDLQTALDQLLLPANLKYVQVGTRSYILVSQKEALSEIALQEIVRGQVTDAGTGETLPGVNVLIQGTTRGTATDANGEFELDVASLQDTLIFSYVGYQTTTIPINSRSTLDVELLQQSLTGEEIVVVGYGVASRANIATSISSVRGEELVDRPTAINLTQSLAGRVAGVNVMTNSGKPGGAPAIKIRGVGSINASSVPLYVVDGIVGVDPEMIDPNMVESIDILKDAASSAIYGARGANGVVLITTKRNRSGAPNNITYSSTVSFGTLPGEVGVLDAEGALEMFRLKYDYPYRADPDTPRYAPHHPLGQSFERKDELFNPDGTPIYNTNWQREATRTSVSYNHAISFIGGTEELNIMASVNYRDNEGIMLNSYHRALNSNINIGWDVKPWLNIEASLNGGVNQQNNVDLNPLSSTALRKTYEFLPFLPVQYADGTYSKNGDYPGAETSENPVRLLNEVDNVVGRSFTLANIIGRFTLSEQLDFVTIFGGQASGGYDNYYAGNSLQGVSQSQGGIATRTHTNSGLWNMENYFNYVNSFNRHHINLLGGASWYYARSSFTQAGSEDFFDDYYRFQNLAAGAVTRPPSSGTSGNQMNSYYARANYNFDERYLFGATFRLDGSSRFGENNKYGSFTSFSAGWNITNEDFFGDNLRETVSNLKLRASWGAVGNAEIGDYVTLPQLRNASATFGGSTVSTVYLGALGNPDLTWESSEQLDIGIDLGLFNNRINIVADYYNKVNRDLLYFKQLPITTGFSGVFDNIGDIRNRGVELEISTLNVLTSNFQWNSSVNFTRNVSKVLNLNGDIMYPWGKRIMEGRPLDEFFGFVREGIWGTNEADEAALWNSRPGDIKFKDVNGDGVIDANDREVLGNAMPTFETNIRNTFSYKSLSLMIDLQSMYGLSLQNTTKHLMQRYNSQVNSYTDVLGAWTPDNQDTIIPALRTPNDPDSPWQVIDNYNTEDASFIRIRNISLSYMLSNDWLNSLMINNLTLGVTVENAFLFSRYSGVDPEYTSFGSQLEQGVDIYQYPKPRTYSFSIRANF